MNAQALAPVAAEDRGPAGPLRTRAFLLFWIGESISLYGIQVFALALPLCALHYGASAGDLGLLRFIQFLPYILFGLVIGAAADRARKRSAMIAANVARLLLIGAVPALAEIGLLHMPLIYLIGFLVGIATILYDVSYMSFVPYVIKTPDGLVAANARLAMSSSSALVAGPALAGVLIAASSPARSLLATAVTYGISLVTLAFLGADERQVAARPAQPIRADIAEGLRWVRGNAILCTTAVTGSACNLVAGMLAPIFLAYAVSVEHLSSSQIGVVFAVGALGGFAGAALVRRTGRRLSQGRIYAVGTCLVFATPLLLPLAGGGRMATCCVFCVSYFLSQFGFAISNVVSVSARQSLTPPEMLARVSSVMRTLLYGSGAIGALLSDGLAWLPALHDALWAIAIVGLSFFAISLVCHRRIAGWNVERGGKGGLARS